MRFGHPLRFLLLPACMLGAALVLACSDGPAAPDSAPSLAVGDAGTATYVDDDGHFYCKTNYVLVYSGSSEFSQYDTNQNGFICQYQQGGSRGRDQYVDDVDLTCRNGYGLLYSGGSFAGIWDFNDNDYICGLISKH